MEEKEAVFFFFFCALLSAPDFCVSDTKPIFGRSGPTRGASAHLAEFVCVFHRAKR